MAFARTCSVALVGVDGVVVEVQADLEPGLATFALVGLPDKALSEAKDRVRAAVVNSGEPWPQRKLTVGLSPASVPKSGSGFDLAVACAVLAAAERLDPATIADLLIIGELGLDGRVRPVRGVLPSVLAAADAGYRQVIVAEQTAPEAALVPDVSVRGVRSLRQLIAILTGAPEPDEPADHGVGRRDSALAGLMLPGAGVRGLTAERAAELDLADVAGQHQARRALEIAAAGGHHLFLKGPPGAGKTMLAERLPALLPPLTQIEALEVTAVHSVAGLLPTDRPLIDSPPYYAPHHSTTMPAIVGGGSGLPRPGAVSLAHRGILFLDEAPEFPVRVLDALRQPLESGEVTIARSAGSVRLPARFQLCLAANPCPCGRHSRRGEGCECTPTMVSRYQSRLSGPLLDRVDLQVQVEPVTRAELMGQSRAEGTREVAARVLAARARAAERLADTPWRTNAEVPGHTLRTRWRLAPGALADAERDLERGLLTARGLDRVLRVAWTVADLADRDQPTRIDIRTALVLRTGVQRGLPERDPAVCFGEESDADLGGEF
ncbi:MULTISPECIES: YifB family Mg chelatase-like AAA ATPase [unclassified Kitasatospora]|uniref:YifB family Mg chelatase-like AAA ATPase n=1 Tax=unclassified Kitasatospora TaxID=2633591 RepID=UPI0009E7EE57|nr:MULTISPECIES: YifB family Mg chelatase-like AAA ATPase [unclassified Kitasatospora]